MTQIMAHLMGPSALNEGRFANIPLGRNTRPRGSFGFTWYITEPYFYRVTSRVEIREWNMESVIGRAQQTGPDQTDQARAE